MKKIYLLTTLIICCCLASQAQNILNNPGFEDGKAWWNLQAPDTSYATADFASAEAHSGTKACHINVKKAATDNWKIQINLPNNYTAKLIKYKLTFWAKADKNVSVHMAAQRGAGGKYAYKTGNNYNLTQSWQEFQMTYTSDTTGAGELCFNLFLGAAAANYYIDDFVLEEVTDVVRSAPNPPAEGAYYTNIYRNLFKEAGKSEEAITNKINAAFNQLFHGDTANQAIYFTLGDDMAYIKAIDSKDIRSEGISYGMMIAVQMDKKEEFDRLWKFATTYMRHASGPRAGLFAWQLDPVDFSKKDNSTAPDGEEYIAMSLFFASHRWGNGTGIFNYEQEAQNLLDIMLNLETRNGGQINNLTNIFDKTRKQVVFVPDGAAATFTDPSYHLPGFYRLWAEWAKKDNQFWKDAADTSKAFFLRARHPQSGLYTDYMTFEGQPKTVDFNGNADNFAYDSYRIISNISMDAHWFGAETWHKNIADKMLNFFNSQGSNYKGLYEYDGTVITTNNYPSVGHGAMNSSGALASSDVVAWKFVDALFDAQIATGTYRYYDGLLQMLGLLHTSGNFRIWKPAITDGQTESSVKNIKVYPNPAAGGNEVFFIETGFSDGEVTLNDLTGKALKITAISNGKAKIDASGLNAGVYFIRATNGTESIIGKVVKQ
jgi:endo-1,4-beta-D-glucanase Y